MQLRDNWQLGGENHGWEFTTNNLKNAEYFLCIEQAGNGYQTQTGEHSCDEIFSRDEIKDNGETSIYGKTPKK